MFCSRRFHRASAMNGCFLFSRIRCNFPESFELIRTSATETWHPMSYALSRVTRACLRAGVCPPGHVIRRSETPKAMLLAWKFSAVSKPGFFKKYRQLSFSVAAGMGGSPERRKPEKGKKSPASASVARAVLLTGGRGDGMVRFFLRSNFLTY